MEQMPVIFEKQLQGKSRAHLKDPGVERKVAVTNRIQLIILNFTD